MKECVQWHEMASLFNTWQLSDHFNRANNALDNQANGLNTH